MNARYRQKAAALEKERQARNENDAHWHCDMWVYWTQQEVPPKDPRWMPAWLSTHSNLPALARNPNEQREARLAALKDALYDMARRHALRRLNALP